MSMPENLELPFIGQRTEMITLRIDPSLFLDFPTFRRGIVAAVGLSETMNRSEFNYIFRSSGINDNPPTRYTEKTLSPAWQETFTALGYDIVPYLTFLSERASERSPHASVLPFWVWRFVADIVRKFGLPIGVFGMDKAFPGLDLTRTSGLETFAYQSSNETKANPIEAGEIVLFNAARNLVMARNWNLRLAKDGDQDCQDVIITVDAIGPGSESAVTAAKEAVFRGLQQACRGPIVAGTLDYNRAGLYLAKSLPDQIDPGRLTLSLENL